MAELSGPPQTRHYWAIGHKLDSNGTLMNYCEISDLTVNCNLGSQTGSAFACGAIRLMGHHTKVYRVKEVGWGTKSSGPSCHSAGCLHNLAIRMRPPTAFAGPHASCIAPGLPEWSHELTGPNGLAG